MEKAKSWISLWAGLIIALILERLLRESFFPEVETVWGVSIIVFSSGIIAALVSGFIDKPNVLISGVSIGIILFIIGVKESLAGWAASMVSDQETMTFGEKYLNIDLYWVIGGLVGGIVAMFLFKKRKS